jgi:hypothetical protein
VSAQALRARLAAFGSAGSVARRRVDTDQAAAHVGAPNRKAFRQWADRARVPFLKRGRVRVYDLDDLDRALEGSTFHAGSLRAAG